MMRQIGRAFGLWLLFTLFLQAGAFDFVTLHQAKEAYEKGDFAKAARLYESLTSSKGDAAWLNAGDAWYKKGAYQKALEAYRKVRDPALQFQKWHNLGNTYAHLGKIDEGIKAYEKALSIKKDADTQYNLDLLKKLKKKPPQKKSQPKKQMDKKQDPQQKERQGSQSSSKKASSKNGKKSQEDHQKESTKKEKKRSTQPYQSQQPPQKRSQSRKKSTKELKPSQEKIPRVSKEPPISNMELRKYERMLERRHIQTLMLPMPVKEPKRSNDEIKPW